EEPVEAAGGGDLGGVDGARLAQAQADGELPGAQLAQGVIGNDGAHALSPLVNRIRAKPLTPARRWCGVAWHKRRPPWPRHGTGVAKPGRPSHKGRFHETPAIPEI